MNNKKEYKRKKKKNNTSNQISNKKRKKEKSVSCKNPGNLKMYKIIDEDLFCSNNEKSFIVFNSINNIFYLIYIKSHSLISYDLNEFKKINEIKNAHNENISNIIHIVDQTNKCDLIISISKEINNIKLWNINNFECLYNFEKIYESGLLSACLLNDNNKIYIIVGNDSPLSNYINVFNLNGNKIKDINTSIKGIISLYSYFDIELSKNYIIAAQDCTIVSYDYNKNELYKKYDCKNVHSHENIIINDKDKIIKLIESSGDGYVRIWGFHSGKMIKAIQVGYFLLRGICLWNSEYLFVGCGNSIITLLSLKKGIIIKNFYGHRNHVEGIKKVYHPKLGECLISEGFWEDKIILWK